MTPDSLHACGISARLLTRAAVFYVGIGAISLTTQRFHSRARKEAQRQLPTPRPRTRTLADARGSAQQPQNLRQLTPHLIQHRRTLWK
jgi:hypothetical protein